MNPSHMQVHICVWTSAVLIDNFLQTIYFRNIWNLTEEEGGKVISLDKLSSGLRRERSYKYHKFEDGMRVLKQVLRNSIED